MSATWGLRFGSIDFSPAAQIEDVERRVYGFSRGKPVPVTRVVDSMLQDGAVEVVDSHGNRDQSLLLGFRSPDAEALAQAESELFNEVRKVRNELAWTPPDGFGATTVFDVLWADLEFSDDAADWDIDELRGFRTYMLTFRALPFGRSDTEVVDAALTSGATPTTVTIADGTSAANWTGKGTAGAAATVTASGGTLRIAPGSSELESISTGTYYTERADYIYTPGSPIDFSSTPYLAVDYKAIVGGTVQQTTIHAYADGVELTQLTTMYAPSGTPGFYQAIFLVADASVASLRFHLDAQNFFPNGSTVSIGLPFEIDNVTRSNQSPSASSTGKQSLRTVAVQGSARTQASLAVQHETAGLGDVLVYTCPSLSDSVIGYQPPLRQWRSSGNTVGADANAVTGSKEGLSGVIFDVPAAGLPRGGYVLMGRLRGGGVTSTVRISWSVATRLGSTSFGTQSGISGYITLPADTWTIAPLGGMTLPPTDVSGSSVATVRLSMGTAAGVEYDELWLFYLGDNAALTQVACGSGTPALGTVHNRLWIDTPSLVNTNPTVWKGTLTDRSDAFHAGDNMPSWLEHSFAPPSMKVFVVTTGAANPAVSLRHFPRFHTHATQVA